MTAPTTKVRISTDRVAPHGCRPVTQPVFSSDSSGSARSSASLLRVPRFMPMTPTRLSAHPRRPHSKCLWPATSVRSDHGFATPPSLRPGVVIGFSSDVRSVGYTCSMPGDLRMSRCCAVMSG